MLIPAHNTIGTSYTNARLHMIDCRSSLNLLGGSCQVDTQDFLIV
jgi:hypothetical protein